MAHIQEQKFAELGFQKSTSSHKLVSYHKQLIKANSNTPILVLLHGYPNSAYLWRHIIPLLPHPLFIPDLPGYGNSSAPEKHDKVSVGLLILAALRELIDSFNKYSDSSHARSPEVLPIVLIGHDRGARVAHHLHLYSPNAPILGFTVKGLALLDIVPTHSQWAIGDEAEKATGWFHWSFLANPSIAVPMIQAYGGGKWAGDMIERWAGTNASAREKMKEGDALAVYSSFFNHPEVIEATTRDYEAGATTDVEFEKKAIEEGRRIVVPLLLAYSAGFLPKRAKKPILEVWSQPWSEGAHLITEWPIGDGVGHFVPEEAPEETAQALGKWLQTL
ncbi:alpha/beta-hydrolase [Macroventuria anomochaeta]|uniref:Alpha/beta-hydrolase n=1 Tax=Macroventuria anomochaeta TaxID=301207 RepID=A0ACB6RY76_9PLEO|nr:alpha/beta-hydrolase [Macroventuria anomochaeta]KAF2626991.1 alpha/beta-hydrolase [Macroventuria anomochaeta]